MKRLWYVLAACTAALGLLIGGFAVFAGSFTPRGYVADKYQRFPERDIDDDAKAYRAKQAPSQVAKAIADQWKPAGQHVDASGIYLRYADDTVVLLPLAAGTLILVEDIRTAHRRYSGNTTGSSSWIYGRGVGNTGRGGGPGSGK